MEIDFSGDKKNPEIRITQTSLSETWDFMRFWRSLCKETDFSHKVSFSTAGNKFAMVLPLDKTD